MNGVTTTYAWDDSQAVGDLLTTSSYWYDYGPDGTYFGGELGLGLNTFGTTAGIAGWFIDATGDLDPAAWGMPCH